MKCSHCRMIAGQCMCYRIPQSDMGCEILILRHFKEAKKSTNSAGLAAVGINRCQIRDVMGSRFRHYEARDGDVLLFPAAANSSIYDSDTPPKRLIVIDGSWRQARKIARKTEGGRFSACREANIFASKNHPWDAHLNFGRSGK